MGVGLDVYAPTDPFSDGTLLKFTPLDFENLEDAAARLEKKAEHVGLALFGTDGLSNVLRKFHKGYGVPRHMLVGMVDALLRVGGEYVNMEYDYAAAHWCGPFPRNYTARFLFQKYPALAYVPDYGAPSRDSKSAVMAFLQAFKSAVASFRYVYVKSVKRNLYLEAHKTANNRVVIKSRNGVYMFDHCEVDTDSVYSEMPESRIHEKVPNAACDGATLCYVCSVTEHESVEREEVEEIVPVIETNELKNSSAYFDETVFYYVEKNVLKDDESLERYSSSWGNLTVFNLFQACTEYSNRTFCARSDGEDECTWGFTAWSAGLAGDGADGPAPDEVDPSHNGKKLESSGGERRLVDDTPKKSTCGTCLGLASIGGPGVYRCGFVLGDAWDCVNASQEQLQAWIDKYWNAPSRSCGKIYLQPAGGVDRVDIDASKYKYTCTIGDTKSFRVRGPGLDDSNTRLYVPETDTAIDALAWTGETTHDENFSSCDRWTGKLDEPVVERKETSRRSGVYINTWTHEVNDYVYGGCPNGKHCAVYYDTCTNWYARYAMKRFQPDLGAFGELFEVATIAPHTVYDMDVTLSSQLVPGKTLSQVNAYVVNSDVKSAVAQDHMNGFWSYAGARCSYSVAVNLLLRYD